MKQHANSYQGMNKDTAYDSIAPTFYVDALNVRITTTQGESLGGFTNVKGNEFAFGIPTSGIFNGNSWSADNPAIIGYATIRTRIILFVADEFNKKGWIYDVQYDPSNNVITTGPTLLYYHKDLNFSKRWPIEALGRYESDCVQRVYWTDYNNFFRSINVEDPNIASLTPGLIDIFPDVKFEQPLIKTVAGGGALTGGIYQISYRLITEDGKQTLVSPPSNIVHIVSDAEIGNSNLYNGDPTPVNTGKAIGISIDTSGYSLFEKIEFLSIYKSSSTAMPIVTSIEEVTIANNSTIEIIYTGAETAAYDVELFDFITRNYQFKTPKTITQKDNSLVIANIKESQIDIQDLLGPGETFNAKTRRYKYNGGSPIPPFTPGTAQADLDNAFNVAYNSDAHWNDTWHSDSQYKYKSDGVRLGGEGPNISYTFHLEKYTLNTTNSPGNSFVPATPDAPHNLNDGYGDYANTSFPNYASPFISGLLRGYKRGETYRFGIVFYTKKGEASFVEYIGDIKFPDISEPDSVVNSSGTRFWPIATNADTSLSDPSYGYALGIQFQVDFSSCPTLFSEIESYQIVRVKREIYDSRRVSQGIIKGYYYNPISNDTPHDFDFRYNEATNVLHLYPYYPLSVSGPTVENASFAVLENSSGSSYVPQYEDYLRLGRYLNFYSPDVSYNNGAVSGSILNTGANPCMLITGAYNAGVSVGANYDFSDQGLGNTSSDVRYTFRNTIPVSYNSKENIKNWQFNELLRMEDTSDYKTKVTDVFSGYYMRNYWLMDDYQDPSDSNPNKPQPGTNSDIPEVYKSGSAIVGQVRKIATDFFTGNSITPSTQDYFQAPGIIRPLDPISSIPFTQAQCLNAYPIVDAVLPKLEVYGGHTVNSLESNKFIPASPILDKLSGNPIVFGGDIFINMYLAQVGMVEFDTVLYGGNKYRRDNSRLITVPVESTLNLDLAHGATFRTNVKYEFDSLNTVAFRQEINNSEAPYAKVLDMYAYNFVYSLEKDDLGFFIRPQNLVNCGANDLRAYLSNVKINEERIDSWTKFGANNYYDIDDYGPINKILNWKDSVFFIQDKGVGTYTINRAAVTTTADGVPTQLGTGLGFGKHVYHSKVHGCIHQWAVDATEMGIYFFDAFHKKIFTIQSPGEGTPLSLPLSEVKGIHSWLQQLPAGAFYRKENGGDNPILGQGVHITKDVINDEVLFTFLSISKLKELERDTTYEIGEIIYYNYAYYYIINQFTTGSDPAQNLILLVNNSSPATYSQVFNSDTIVYDELAQQFSSRYTMTPPIWINNGNILMSPNALSPGNVYINNKGDWGVFYDTVENTELTLVINPDADINKVLRLLEYNSIVRDNNKVITRTKTLTGFRVYNQYQDTEFVPFSPERFKRKFDKWRLKIPRDQNSLSKQGRLRSTYFVVTLYFDNTDNKEIIVNKLISHFDYQIF